MTEGALCLFVRLLAGGGASQHVLSCPHMDNHKKYSKESLTVGGALKCTVEPHCQDDVKKIRSESLDFRVQRLKGKESNEDLHFDYSSNM